MKKVLLIALISSGVSLVNAQTQIGNSGFENWESVASNEEPVNWNSFLTASGPSWITSFAANQVASSTDVRPGSTGTKSCRIWSRNPIGSVIANGNVTVGRINMGSTTPSSPDNHNKSIIADPNFSEALTDQPDSIVFWAKFTPNGHTQNARMKSTLHTNNEYRDPEDGTSATYVVARAVKNFPSTAGVWKRFSVPFDYAGPASVNTHILVTFTTNETPGGGAEDDELLIDDVELIYNPATSGISTIDKNDGIMVGMDNTTENIIITSANDLKGEYKVYNTLGQEVQNGTIATKISFDKGFGTYFVHLTTGGKEYTFEILKD